MTDLRAPALRQSPPVQAAFGHAARSLITIVASMQAAVDGLDAELDTAFDAHSHAAILT